MTPQETISASELRRRLKKRPKYRNEKVWYNGARYDSKREAAVAQRLDLLVKAGAIVGYERQVPFRFVFNGVRIATHRADFVVREHHGTIEVLDAKGYPNDRWPLVKKLMLAFHGIKVREV